MNWYQQIKTIFIKAYTARAETSENANVLNDFSKGGPLDAIAEAFAITIEYLISYIKNLFQLAAMEAFYTSFKHERLLAQPAIGTLQVITLKNFIVRSGTPVVNTNKEVVAYVSSDNDQKLSVQWQGYFILVSKYAFTINSGTLMRDLEGNSIATLYSTDIKPYYYFEDPPQLTLNLSDGDYFEIEEGEKVLWFPSQESQAIIVGEALESKKIEGSSTVTSEIINIQITDLHWKSQIDENDEWNWVIDFAKNSLTLEQFQDHFLKCTNATAISGHRNKVLFKSLRPQTESFATIFNTTKTDPYFTFQFTEDENGFLPVETDWQIAQVNNLWAIELPSWTKNEILIVSNELGSNVELEADSLALSDSNILDDYVQYSNLLINNGSDQETDEARMLRFASKLDELNGCTEKGIYKAILKLGYPANNPVEKVTDCIIHSWVYYTDLQPGTILVFIKSNIPCIDDPENNRVIAASTSLIQTVNDALNGSVIEDKNGLPVYLDSLLPAGITAQVSPIEATLFDFSITIAVSDNFYEISNTIESKIRLLFQNTNIGGEIKRTDLDSVILKLKQDGLLDYQIDFYNKIKNNKFKAGSMNCLGVGKFNIRNSNAHLQLTTERLQKFNDEHIVEGWEFRLGLATDDLKVDGLLQAMIDEEFVLEEDSDYSEIRFVERLKEVLGLPTDIATTTFIEFKNIILQYATIMYVTLTEDGYNSLQSSIDLSLININLIAEIQDQIYESIEEMYLALEDAGLTKTEISYLKGILELHIKYSDTKSDLISS